MKFSLTRLLAILRARLREFYRDTASWAWNLLMPVLILIGFAFIFSGDTQPLYRLAVIGDPQLMDSLLRDADFVERIRLSPTARDQALVKLQRHQYDLLLDVTVEPPRYWINSQSDKGRVMEQLLLNRPAVNDGRFQRAEVSGKDLRYVDWVMPGVLAMNMMFSCLWGVGWVVVRYRKNGVLRRLQATPLTAFEFLSAQVLARMVIVVFVTSAVIIGANALVGFVMRGSWWTLALVFTTGALCLTSLGLIVATRLKTEEVAEGLLNLMSWPMMILSGVWFSMESAHPVAQAISAALPLTWLVDAARRVMLDGAGVAEVAGDLMLMSLTTLLLLGVSARLFRWS